jgi:tetratricopeptide (TPR) repeat protein
MSPLTCPGEETIVAFAEGRLRPEALARVESHAANCPICQDLFAAAVKGRAGNRSLHTRDGIDGARSIDQEQNEFVVRPLLTRGARVGRYTVLAPVGRGGMGEVYSAYDPRLDRKVALKLLQAGASNDRERAQARLLREARAMAKLSHRNVVAVHDTGTFAGRVYVAMEFVDGATLTDWLADHSRSRSEILAVFVAAARGLAAAHAAGLVHRDFKPGNVMIARNGAVRVMDFGLARSLAGRSDEDSLASPAGTYADLRLTQTGERLGTPLFMAPEQLADRATDARTDQFSFCVALYRALYGAPPFRADTLETLTLNVLAGRIEPAPAHASVPTWLRSVVVRGLAVDPAERWPAMEDLVAALQRDPAQLRRRRGLAAGAAVLVGLSVLALVRGARSKPPLCLGGPGRLAVVWEDVRSPTEPPSRRRDVERAILASGAPFATEIWDRVAAALDRYRTRWLSTYLDACEATSVRHVQPTHVLELRMTCLDEARLSLSALTTVLSAADQEAAKHAVDAANGLPSLERCSDPKQLESGVESPRDEATRRRVDDVRARAATTKAINDTGKHDQAMERVRLELAEARRLAYRPLVAEELVALVRTSPYGSNFRTQDVPIAEEAVWASLAVGRDDLAAEAAMKLSSDVGHYMARHEEGRRWANLAHAILDRLGGGHDLLLAWLLTDEGALAFNMEGAAAELPLLERALALKEKVLPPDHPDLATTMLNQAEALAGLGRASEALAVSKRACDVFIRAYGLHSTEAAMCLSNQSEYLIALGRPADALAPARQALANWEVELGPNHPFVAYPLTALGRAYLAITRPRDALPPLERAWRIRREPGSEPMETALTEFTLARALWDAGGERARAISLAKAARTLYSGTPSRSSTAEIGAWLGAHGVRP